MQIHILSDLHLEYSSYQPHGATAAADVIVLAGDIAQKENGIPWARSTWPDQEIVFVAGNHEFYGTDMQETRARMRVTAQKFGVHFLDCDEVVIDGVRFLGCTGWTDFELFGEDLTLECIDMAARSINDFHRIRHPDNKAGRFTPAMSVIEHQKCVAWLAMKLRRESFDGPTVVVTHHAPAWASVMPWYQQDLLSACFASRLEHLMGFSELWVHGHMHDSLDYRIDSTRVICNPRGYARYEQTCENVEFKPDLLVEIGNQAR